MKPRQDHWNAITDVFRYIKGTAHYILVYGKRSDIVNILDFTNSDFVKDAEFRCSIISYVFTVCGNSVSWNSKLQCDVALLTIESEYIALTKEIRERLWIQGLLQ